MNRPGIVDAEFCNIECDYFDFDSLPESLIEFLKLLCADFGPELVATAQAFDDWLNAEPSRPPGSLVSVNSQPTLRQSLGTIDHVQQGIKIEREAWPDILLMHQDIVGIVDGMPGPERHNYEELMNMIGGEDFLTVQLQRSLVRAAFSTVLG